MKNVIPFCPWIGENIDDHVQQTSLALQAVQNPAILPLLH